MDSSSSSSRKFVQLIFETSSKWANWNPPYIIQVGDFGRLDKATGMFNREGNIYDDTHIFDERLVNVVKSNTPLQGAREDDYIAASKKVKRCELRLDPKVEIIGLANASIKGQWSFGRERGALLIMAYPRCSYIPRDSLLAHIAEVEALRGKVLVTEVFSCPAYSLYLSNKSNDVVDLALLGSFPVPNAPGLTAGAGVEARWWSQNTSGLFRSARDPSGKYDYTPLYMIKEISNKPKRGLSTGSQVPIVEPEGDEHWTDVKLPWTSLDEDGEEEGCDAVFSD